MHINSLTPMTSALHSVFSLWVSLSYQFIGIHHRKKNLSPLALKYKCNLNCSYHIPKFCWFYPFCIEIHLDYILLFPSFLSFSSVISPPGSDGHMAGTLPGFSNNRRDLISIPTSCHQWLSGYFVLARLKMWFEFAIQTELNAMPFLPLEPSIS